MRHHRTWSKRANDGSFSQSMMMMMMIAGRRKASGGAEEGKGTLEGLDDFDVWRE